jgi:diketogulonate reductase-like aldo/keto reductase
MKRITLPCGETVPALGQGTWHMGEESSLRSQEIDTLRHGIDLGLTLIDTAEMYGDGAAETLVGEAIQARRDRVFLVSKVYPHNASRRKMQAACNESLKRLRVDAIDLYLLHWPGTVPLAETVASFEDLKRDGKIRHWGVSNLDLVQMKSLECVPGGAGAQVNQLLYNLGRRGIEWDLLPWLRAHRMPVMAYSPIEQGRLLREPAFLAFSKRLGMTPAQVAIAWLLAQDDVIAIPKTASRQRLEENAGALAHSLTPENLRELAAMFPPPSGPTPLEML